MAGTSTTNGPLNYCILYLLLNPVIQPKCQQEIGASVPKHLTSTMDNIEKYKIVQEKL